MEKDLRKKFACEICEKGFLTNDYKKQHIAVVHGEEKKFVCNVCSRSFSYKKILTSHIENTHQGGHHSCKSCGKILHLEKRPLS